MSLEGILDPEISEINKKRESSQGFFLDPFWEDLKCLGLGYEVHPGRLTWNIIMEVRKIIFLSKWVICRFHVNLPRCNQHIWLGGGSSMFFFFFMFTPDLGETDPI